MSSGQGPERLRDDNNLVVDLNANLVFPEYFEPLCTFSDDQMEGDDFEEVPSDEDEEEDEIDFSDLFSSAVEEHLISSSASADGRSVSLKRPRATITGPKDLEKSYKRRRFGKRPRWRPMALRRAIRCVPRNRSDIRSEYTRMLGNIMNQCTVKSLTGFITKFCGKSFRLTMLLSDETHISPAMCEPCNMSFFNMKTATGYWGLLVHTLPDMTMDFDQAIVVEDDGDDVICDGQGNRGCKVICNFHQVFTRVVRAPPHDACNMVHLVEAMQDKMEQLKEAGMTLPTGLDPNALAAIANLQAGGTTSSASAAALPPGSSSSTGLDPSMLAAMASMLPQGMPVDGSSLSALFPGHISPQVISVLDPPEMIFGIPPSEQYDPQMVGLPPGVQLPEGLSLPPGITLLPTGPSLSPGLANLVTGVTAFVTGLGADPAVISSSFSESSSSVVSSSSEDTVSVVFSDSSSFDVTSGNGNKRSRQKDSEMDQTLRRVRSQSQPAVTPPTIDPVSMLAASALIPAMTTTDAQSLTGSSITDAILRMMDLKLVPVPPRLINPVRHTIIGTLTLRLNARKAIESVEFVGKPIEATLL